MAQPTAAEELAAANAAATNATTVGNRIDAMETQLIKMAAQLQALIMALVEQGTAEALQVAVVLQAAVALQAVVAGVPDQLGRFLPFYLLLDIASTRRNWKNLTATFNYSSCGYGGIAGMTSVN
jgi:hypothetical protein